MFVNVSTTALKYLRSKGKPKQTLIYIQFEDFFPIKHYNGSHLILMPLYDTTPFYLADPFPSISLHFSCNFSCQGFLAGKKQFKYLEWSSPPLSFSWVPCRSVSLRALSSYLTVSYPKDQLCFLARGEGRAWSDCLMLEALFPGDGFMLKLIRNGIMKRFVLLMAAFVSGRPATYDGLPLSPCSLPMQPVFLRPLLDGFFPLTLTFHLPATFVLRLSLLSYRLFYLFLLLPLETFIFPLSFHQVFPWS